MKGSRWRRIGRWGVRIGAEWRREWVEGWDAARHFAPGARPTLSPKIFIHPPSALDSALQPLALAHHKGRPLSSPGRPYSIYFVPLVWVGV